MLNENFGINILPDNSIYRPYHYKCGHAGARKFTVFAHGMSISPHNDRMYDFCPECFLKKARREIIKCARCGLPIFPGQGVALYPKQHAIHHNGIGIVEDSVVACLREECTDAVLFSGYWTGNEYEPYFN